MKETCDTLVKVRVYSDVEWVRHHNENQEEVRVMYEAVY